MDFYDIWFFDWIRNSKGLMNSHFFQNSLKKIFRPTLLVLIPTVGVFINNKIGWTLITTFLYFCIFLFSFFIIENDFDFKKDSFHVFLISSILFVPLLIINKEKIRNYTYGIANSAMIKHNIISTVIGMALAIYIVYLINSRN